MISWYEAEWNVGLQVLNPAKSIDVFLLLMNPAECLTSPVPHRFGGGLSLASYKQYRLKILGYCRSWQQWVWRLWSLGIRCLVDFYMGIAEYEDTVFWDVTTCSLVDKYQWIWNCSLLDVMMHILVNRYVSTKLHSITSQKIIILKILGYVQDWMHPRNLIMLDYLQRH
jgi:hypothetical protein